jgi:photosystem II stability/assembly factor-like uncharacterized protein
MPYRIGRIAGIVLSALTSLASAALFAQSGATTDPQWTTTWPSLGEASSLLLDPANPLRLFAGTDLGLATTVDGGQTWSLQPGTPASLRALVLDPSSPARLVGGSTGGVFTSLDGGAHFSPAISNATVAMAMDPSDPRTIYAAGFGDQVFKSTDGGATWSSNSVNAPLTRSIAALIVDPQNHDRVFAGIGAWHYTYYPAYYGGSSSDFGEASLVGSSDAGQTWKIFLDNTSAAKPVRALALDPRTSQVMYAGYGPYVYRTANGGITWTPGTFALGSLVTSLVVDSVNPDTVYAGSDHGVFRSTDAGAHWAPLAVLPSMDVRAIALEPHTQVLHAATGGGVFRTALGGAPPAFPCQPAADALCLLGGRFRVQAQASDPRTGLFATGRAVAETDSFGYFSLPEFTGDPSFPEILLKLVDAAVPPWNAVLVFRGGLTDLGYLLTVTDLLTGETRSYQNDPDNPGCGGADTAAFPSAPGAGASASATLPPLEATGEALSLLSGHFQLTLTATDPHTGLAITGRAIPRQDNFGYFSLPDLTGDPALPEVFVKMLDARSLTGHFWLFGTGLTSVSYTLTLVDVTTGVMTSYASPGSFCGITDTAVPGTPDAPPPPVQLSRLSGTVLDLNGHPVAGASVTVNDAHDVLPPTVTTNHDGRFAFAGLPPGRWEIVAQTSTRWGSLEVRLPPSADVRVTLRYPGDFGD